jgi:predicted MPP superfamily phosphohydrolase
MTIRSVETKYLERREEILRALTNLDRRAFLRVSGAAAAMAATRGLGHAHSFQPVRVETPGAVEPFRFAYISDSHLYERKLNDRFIRSLLRAVDDVNALDPQPDFVLYGGDLAQLGAPAELDLGAQILKELKAPVKMMVGEHDWYLDLGEKWRGLFGKDVYSFDHKGIHFVVLNSVVEDDFWTVRGLTPKERMQTVAGLDNRSQSNFQVGPPQREWLTKDLEPVSDDTPVIVFSHSPLYHLYQGWNFWTIDAPEVQRILARFRRVTVIHGHTHQLLTNRIKNIHFHGMLSTAWPWPYAPQGLPELTVQMNRPNPFNSQDGCGDGQVVVNAEGLVDKVYNLWNRNVITVAHEYLESNGVQKRPAASNVATY